MNQDQHLKNFDWLRAIASILVVALHYNVISDSLTFEYLSIEIFIQQYILRLPVPLFLIISLFLFTKKTRNFSYLTQRIKKLLILGTIWPFIFYISHGGLMKYVEKIIEILKEVKNSPKLVLHHIFSDLETIYYFFISLAIVLIIAFILQNASSKFIFSILGISLILLLILPIFEVSAFYNPINFIPYAPAAILINRYFYRIYNHRLTFGLVLLTIGIVLMFMEIIISDTTGIIFMDGYTKPSLVFGAIGIFLISFSVQKSNKVIKFMSDFSLPLYLLHPCLPAFSGTISNIIFVKLLKLENLNIYSFFMAIILSYIIAKFILPLILNRAIYTSG